MMICVVVVPNEDKGRLAEALQNLVETRIAEHGLQRVLGIGMTVASRRSYEALSILDRRWWEPATSDGRVSER
jgi:hypothetical protein